MKIQSNSEEDIFYEVDISALTCTCPHFRTKLSKLPIDDPCRLCKHIIQALKQTGIPEHLQQYSDE